MKPPRSEEEVFDLVDDEDRVIGMASRREVHGNPVLLHRVVHVLVFDGSGRIFLQKRAEDKDVQPGKWDSSVGGHVDTGEEREAAALRELSEELGIPGSGNPAPALRFLYRYRHGNDYESELVTTWIIRWDGPVKIQRSEISEGRFWTLEEIDLLAARSAGSSPFTPNFLEELKRWRSAGSPFP